MQFFLSLAILFFWNSNPAFSADTKISALTSLSQAAWAAGDLFAIVDLSTTTTKKTSVADFDGRYVLKVAGLQLSQESFTTIEKTKLSGIATAATANQTDAYLLARANHTGTQAA